MYIVFSATGGAHCYGVTFYFIFDISYIFSGWFHIYLCEGETFDIRTDVVVIGC